MWQFQSIPTTMGNPSLKGNAFTPGHNATPIRTPCLKGKGKKWL